LSRSFRPAAARDEPQPNQPPLPLTETL
jgi:hypothetical protein